MKEKDMKLRKGRCNNTCDKGFVCEFHNPKLREKRINNMTHQKKNEIIEKKKKQKLTGEVLYLNRKGTYSSKPRQ